MTSNVSEASVETSNFSLTQNQCDKMLEAKDVELKEKKRSVVEADASRTSLVRSSPGGAFSLEGSGGHQGAPGSAGPQLTCDV